MPNPTQHYPLQDMQPYQLNQNPHLNEVDEPFPGNPNRQDHQCPQQPVPKIADINRPKMLKIQEGKNANGDFTD